MKSRFAFGIDFGTTTTLLAVYDEMSDFVAPAFDASAINKGPYTIPYTPSLVAFRDKKLYIGWNAYRLNSWECIVQDVKLKLGTNQQITLGDKSYYPEQIAAIILKYVYDLGTEGYKSLGRDNRVVITIPANFPGRAREALLVSAKLAGLSPISLINEPTAAALAYFHNKPEKEENVLIFDFGGGTLDISILRREGKNIYVKSSIGDPKLGGRNIDEQIKSWIESKIDKNTIRGNLDVVLTKEAENAKCTLSNPKEREALIDISYVGNIEGRVGLHTSLDKITYRQLINDILQKIEVLIGKALEQASTLPEEIDSVLLVGGSTRIEEVQDVVKNFFGKEKVKVAETLEYDQISSVAIGAAIFSASHTGLTKKIDLKDVSSYGLGLEYTKPSFQPPKKYYRVLILPNQELPQTNKKVQGLCMPKWDSTSVDIKLYESYAKSDFALLDDNSIPCHELLSDTIENVPISDTQDNPRKLDIQYSYDENSLLLLKIKVEGTNISKTFNYHPSQNLKLQSSSDLIDDFEKLCNAAKLTNGSSPSMPESISEFSSPSTSKSSNESTFEPDKNTNNLSEKEKVFDINSSFSDPNSDSNPVETVIDSIVSELDQRLLELISKINTLLKSKDDIMVANPAYRATIRKELQNAKLVLTKNDEQDKEKAISLLSMRYNKLNK